MKSMGWTTKETLRNVNNVQNDLRQNSVTPPKFKGHNANKMSCCDRCSCECIKKIENTILRSSSPPSNRSRECVAEISPKKSPPHYARPQQCNRHLEPLQPAQQCSVSSKPKPVKRSSRTSLANGGVELAPLLTKRRDERPISLSTTDITKYKINKSR